MMDRRNFLGWVAAACAAAGSAVWVRSVNRAAAVATNTCVQRFTGMRVVRINVVPTFAGANSDYLVSNYAEVVMHGDYGLQFTFSTDRRDTIEEFQLAAITGAPYTFEVTQEVPSGEA